MIATPALANKTAELRKYSIFSSLGLLILMDLFYLNSSGNYWALTENNHDHILLILPRVTIHRNPSQPLRH